MKWHPQVKEKMKRDYAKKVLTKPPKFPLLTNMREQDRALFLEIVRQLNVDFETFLQEDAKLIITDDFTNLDEVTSSEEERKEEQEKGPTDVENEGDTTKSSDLIDEGNPRTIPYDNMAGDYGVNTSNPVAGDAIEMHTSRNLDS